MSDLSDCSDCSDSTTCAGCCVGASGYNNPARTNIATRTLCVGSTTTKTYWLRSTYQIPRTTATSWMDLNGITQHNYNITLCWVQLARFNGYWVCKWLVGGGLKLALSPFNTKFIVPNFNQSAQLQDLTFEIFDIIGVTRSSGDCLLRH